MIVFWVVKAPVFIGSRQHYDGSCSHLMPARLHGLINRKTRFNTTHFDVIRPNKLAQVVTWCPVQIPSRTLAALMLF